MNQPPTTPPDQARVLKVICDHAVARFKGMKPTDSIARRIEIAIHHAVRRRDDLKSFHALAPAVMFDKNGQPSIFFVKSPIAA